LCSYLSFRGNSHAGEILRLVPEEESNMVGILVHNEPSIYGKRIGKVYTHENWNACTVDWTGKEENGWIEIVNQHPEADPSMNIPPLVWIFGEYFGIAVEGDYQPFKRHVTYVTKGECVRARTMPLITSRICGFCRYKGTRIRIVGRKGSWLKTEKGKWVYHELIREVKN